MQKNSIYCFRGVETGTGMRWSLSGIFGQSVPLSAIVNLIDLVGQPKEKTADCINIDNELENNY